MYLKHIVFDTEEDVYIKDKDEYVLDKDSKKQINKQVLDNYHRIFDRMLIQIVLTSKV